MSARNIFARGVLWFFICVGASIPVFVRLSQLENHETEVKKLLGDFSYDKPPITIYGFIDAEPDVKPTSQNFTVHIRSVTASSTIIPVDTRILVNTKLFPKYEYGQVVSISGKIALPRNFADGNSSDENVSNNREFDYVHYLSKDGIFFIMKDPAIMVTGSGAGNPIFAKLFSIKEAFLVNIRRILVEPEASLAAGEIVGDKASLGKELTDDFRRSGLIHIVILSGYSIAIIASSIQRIVSVIPYLPRPVGLFSGALGILLFGIMIGGKATAVRACIMAIMSIGAKIMYRDYHALRALILTAYIMIVQNPYIVAYDASFQVSFTATLGLILLGKHIEHFLKKFPRLFPDRFEIRGLVTSTLATQIAVAPLLLYMMGDASVVGLIANIIVVPFIPITLLVIFCTGMSGFLVNVSGVFASLGVYISTGFGAASHFLLAYELFIVKFFGTFPYAIVTVNDFTLWMMWATYGFYAAGYFILRKRLHRQSSSRSPPN